MISINKDLANKTIHFVREFKAPQQKVWSAWTERDNLDKWWGPKPFNVKTKILDFTEGGHWHYAMIGPQGETFWSICTYSDIKTRDSFKWSCQFCDENGTPNNVFPADYWLIEMSEQNGLTTVNVTVTFDSVADLEQMVKMGFEGGFSMGLNQLEELLG